MSIFKRSSPDVQQSSAAPSPQTGTEARQSVQPPNVMPPFIPASAAPGVVPPAAAPIYSTRVPEPAQRAESEAESLVSEKVRMAREAQQIAQERVRQAVQRARTTPSPAPGAQRRVQLAPVCARPALDPSEPQAAAQTGLLHLAWRWQEAGAPIRAIHTYVELLTRYPGTAAAAAAVADLVTLSEKLADEGQFHTALAIYDQLEELA